MNNSFLDKVEELRSTHGGLSGLILLRALLRGGPLEERTALLSSFGAESIVLLDMVATINPAIPVFFLDTGKLFEATHAYREELTQLLGLHDVRVLHPDPLALTRYDPKGQLWQTDPDLCCHIRKSEPLQRALVGFAAWITGVSVFTVGCDATCRPSRASPRRAGSSSIRSRPGPVTTSSITGACATCRRTRFLPRAIARLDARHALAL